MLLEQSAYCIFTVRKKIAGEFPTYTASTINIIMNSTKFNEEKARKLLETMSRQEPDKR